MYPTITIGSTELSSYNLFFALGAIGLLIYSLRTRKKYDLSLLRATFYSIFLVAAGLYEFKIMGAIQSYFIELKSNGEVILGGSSRIFGVLIFQPIMIYILSLFTGDKFRKIADFIAPGTLICFVFGKFACFLEGCCHGLPDENGVFSHIAEQNVFPVQLYESLSVIPAVVILTILLYKSNKLRMGSLFPIGGILYCIPRMFWENYRYYDNIYQADFFFKLNFWQFFCIIAIVMYVVWLILLYRMPKFAACSLDNRHKPIVEFISKINISTKHVTAKNTKKPTQNKKKK